MSSEDYLELPSALPAPRPTIDDATARALVLHFGLKGAIDYATKIFQMGGPLAKEYGWLADYLTTYKAATEVGRWPKEFER